MKSLALFYTALLLCIAPSVIGQMERPDDPYQLSPRETHAKSPAYSYFSQGFTVVQVNVDIDGNNIINDAANEPSITYDRNNPDRMAIGWRQFDNINNNFRQAGYGYTSDAGQTWTFPGVINPGVFRSDPVLRCDGDGNFYYNSLTNANDIYSTNTYMSSDGGENWAMGTFAYGGDKQWISIDMTKGIGEGNIYEFWNGAYSVCATNNFTRSSDWNATYEDCSSIPGDPIWGTTFVSPEGKLYVAGAFQFGGFMVGMSSDAQDPSANVSWDWTVSVNLGGEIIGFGGDQCPNPSGLLGQTMITMDSTGGPGDGNIYILCSVDTYVNSDPCDVMFARSTDGGLTWSAPWKINDDTGNSNYQWFGTMSVAPDGRIDVVWLDTRNNLGSVNSALYYSYSLDQGFTWTPNVKLSETFDPHVGWPQQDKMGDYFDMYSDEAGAHLAWAATFNGEQDVYYSLITPSYVNIAENEKAPGIISVINYPNPFIDQTTIRYNLVERGFVTLKVFTMDGKEISTLVNAIQDAGQHTEIFKVEGIESGVYYFRIESGETVITKKIIVI
jgi:hypothetical protein